MNLRQSLHQWDVNNRQINKYFTRGLRRRAYVPTPAWPAMGAGSSARDISGKNHEECLSLLEQLFAVPTLPDAAPYTLRVSIHHARLRWAHSWNYPITPNTIKN